MPKKTSLSLPASRFSPVISGASLPPFPEMTQDQGKIFWEWLDAFFAKLTEGVILTGPDGRVAIFNEAAGAFLGYRPEEVVGRLFLWDLGLNQASGYSPLFKRGLENGNSFPEEEVEFVAKDDPQRTFKARVCGLYGREGELLGAFANLGSLAEHRAVEREHRTMVRKVSIGKIISALAHEINNPLQSLRTSLELGLDSRKNRRHRAGYLELANTEISRISQIVMTLRRFYPSNDHETLSADVNFLLLAALETLKKDFNQKEIMVEFDLAEDLPPVRLIAHQLQNIFQSLLQDLLETVLPGSSITIQTHSGPFDAVSVTLASVPAQPLEGSSPDQFDPLAFSHRQGRLALDLSISREIIIEHGGSLEMGDETGKTFRLSLPLA
ncbi:MAG: PAS domain-containing protein [Chloroflexi bacterium]|nr:PAS domain-containing protein [Chloroflexota bacterium]OJV93656.1 MAG: hypothetical protein BGO39_15160 [Chloroflexi bacterium 54-19]